jgi:hypothetical protein
MNLILALVLLGLAATPLAVLLGWLDRRGSRPLGALLHGRDSEGWWRATMPWPQGVQEDDEVTWTFRERQPTGQATTSPVREEANEADEVRIEPTHLRAKIRRR